jgi:hypothetical protein
MNSLNVNQIVKGKHAGVFVILGFRTVGGLEYAQLKEVNPANHAEVAPGELCLPADCLEALA